MINAETVNVLNFAFTDHKKASPKILALSSLFNQPSILGILCRFYTERYMYVAGLNERF